jgi:two-component system phosphate regulon sensor histidine kinase PhoR
VDAAFVIILLLAVLSLVAAGWWSERRAREEAEASVWRAEQAHAEMLAPSRLLVALAAVIEDGLLVLEVDRRISFVNDAVGRLLELPATNIRGQTLMAALRHHEADAAVERAFASGERESITFELPRTKRTLRLTCQPLAGTGYGAIVVLRDITRLAQLERARREMVANVSHELRTPLASIRLLTETLVSEPPPDAARRMLGQIDDELAALTQLVDELHELSQIESGRLALSMRPVSVPDLVAAAMERLRPQAERHGLALHADFPPGLPAVLVDKERIGQVLLNLLHNALKWTPAGGRIGLCACIATPQLDERTARELERVAGPGWIKVSVCDTGIGIPAGETERIFERFYKVDRARTRDRGGSGLGLAIAKHVVEGHGGRIWAESQAGHGSTFSMLLPTA